MHLVPLKLTSLCIFRKYFTSALQIKEQNEIRIWISLDLFCENIYCIIKGVKEIHLN